MINGYAVIDQLNKKDSENYDKLIEVLQPSLKNDSYYIAFSRKTKDFEKKVKIFNKGLMEIKNNGTFDSILKNYQL